MWAHVNLSVDMTDMIDVSWSAVATLAPIKSVTFFWPMFVYIGLHAEMSLIATSGLLPLRNKWCVHTKTIHRPFPTHKLLLIMEVCVLWLCGHILTSVNQVKPDLVKTNRDGKTGRVCISFKCISKCTIYHLQLSLEGFCIFLHHFIFYFYFW